MWARRGITCGSVVMSGLFSPCAAQTVPVSIPAQPVESAIVALGKVAHVQIIGVRRQISGKNARAVDGVMDTRQALDRLLAGTGLMVRQSGPATFVIVEEPASVPRRRPASPEPIKPPAPIMPSVPALTMANAQIIVTGSRLISNGNNLPTPVTALSSAELLENDPSSLIAAIYELPALLGSISLTSNINTGGLNAINLRGIGVNRSLLMVDARRAGPTSGENTINPDIVPQILLQRVDVVTGGGSAIYGSDAVAGVVNFVTDKEFNGFKAHVQNGISTYGDDNKFDIGAAWGGGFAQGRGHLVLGAQWRESVGITSRQVRPFTANTIWSEHGSVPGGGTPGSVGNNASFGGLINSGPLAGLQFASNGLLSTFHHGTPTGTPGVEVGGDGAYFVDSSLSAWQKLHNSYARADFDITPDIGLFGTLAYSHFRQGYQGQNPYLNGIEISFANPVLSTIQPEYRAIIAQQSPEATMRISKIAAELPNYSMQYQQSYYQATLGIKGKAGPAGWNADYSHSDSHLTLSNLHDINTGRLMAALDAIGDGKGGAVCRAAILNPGKYGQCVPLNIFGPSAASQPAIGGTWARGR
jgi:iron complex outermembrane receptor protein